MYPDGETGILRRSAVARDFAADRDANSRQSRDTSTLVMMHS
jgi:hypothetical protein